MQTEITTDYVRKLQQQFRDSMWETIISGIRCINPSLSAIHTQLTDQIKKDPDATEYRVHVGTLRIRISSSVDPDDILEEFLNCYSSWMDRYVPSAHAEVKVVPDRAIEFWFVFTLLL